MTCLPPDQENTIRLEHWCRKGSRQGNRYLPQRMSDAEAQAWAHHLGVIFHHRNTDF